MLIAKNDLAPSVYGMFSAYETGKPMLMNFESLPENRAFILALNALFMSITNTSGMGISANTKIKLTGN